MDVIQMIGYQIFTFGLATVALLVVLVWLLMRIKSAKSEPLIRSRSESSPATMLHGRNPHAAKWVDTYRRNDSTLQNMCDTLGPQTEITEIQDHSTVLEETAEQTWRASHNSPVRKESIHKPDPIKAPTVPLMSVETAAIDRKISTLHKEATAFKGRDWPGAIAALEKAAVLDAAHSRWNDMTRMVRLPTFLQQAGRFEEAMAEFDRLIERVPVYVQEHAASSNELARSATLHREYEILYNKMRLACKREKQHEQAEIYAQKSAVHRQALDGLKDLKKSKRKK